jgi:hypothetical protein
MTRTFLPSSRTASGPVDGPSSAVPFCGTSPGALALFASAPPTTKIEKVDPLLVSIADARTISGLSRSELYRRLAAGKIRAVKCGSRTLIVLESLIEHLKSLPTATFHLSR